MSDDQARVLTRKLIELADQHVEALEKYVTLLEAIRRVDPFGFDNPDNHCIFCYGKVSHADTCIWQKVSE